MSYLFERCQYGGAPTDANQAPGEAGTGVYAYVAPSRALRSYYSARGETVYRLTLHPGFLDAAIIDLTGPLMKDAIAFAKQEATALSLSMPGYQKPRITATTIQRFGRILELFITQRYPEAVAYIVPHRGPGLPTGKQVVIRKMAAFKVTPIS